MKNKTTRVYKVVMEKDKEKLSSYVYNETELVVNYKIGKFVYPRIGTKLFAFTNLKQARNYAFIRGETIYRAEGINVHSNGWMNNIVSLTTARQWFSEDAMPKPDARFDSCVVCDAIKLIKKVH